MMTKQRQPETDPLRDLVEWHLPRSPVRPRSRSLADLPAGERHETPTSPTDGQG